MIFCLLRIINPMLSVNDEDQFPYKYIVQKITVRHYQNFPMAIYNHNMIFHFSTMTFYPGILYTSFEIG